MALGKPIISNFLVKEDIIRNANCGITMKHLKLEKFGSKNY